MTATTGADEPVARVVAASASAFEAQLATAREESLVGEGLALGCIALGVRMVSPSEEHLELSLVGAWTGWPSAGAFPRVGLGLAPRPGMGPLLTSHAGRPDVVASWDHRGGSLLPVIRREGWGIDDVADHVELVSGVPARAWVALADRFVVRLDPFTVHLW